MIVLIARKLSLILAVLLLLSVLCGCTPEPEKNENFSEDLSESESSESDLPKEDDAEKTAEEIAEKAGYMTLEEITAAGYYPSWMQPGSYIVYDNGGVPAITEGGELLPEDLLGRPEFEVMPFTSIGSDDPFMEIFPNTKAEYDLHGFIQNIYYLWPDGSYNLSPPFHNLEYAEITYYDKPAELENNGGQTVVLNEVQYFDIYMLAEKMKITKEESEVSLDFPCYEIKFINEGTEHRIFSDINNTFSSTLLDEKNYVNLLNRDYFLEAKEIFNTAQ